MGYLFEPKVLHECANAGLNHQGEAMFDAVTEELARRYPGHIDTGPRKWIFNNAGGAMGQIAILHASLSEYVLIFGNPIGTEGHSGRYRTEVHDFMLSGEMWCFQEGQTERVVYKPGDHAYLGPSEAKGYRVPSDAFMLEYARGAVPTMLAFGLADTVTSTLDLSVMARTLGAYTGKVMRSLLQGKI